ncbi:MAG: PQQ-binding-like beta-propeller repeat protein, partial [Planctomycetes bacterium]|nr:PQQ-binding-like beta-propeller repeat protein [Planctomycetota bacterium]
YVEGGSLDRLFLADSVADALIANGSAAGMPPDESQRVVRPGGIVWLGATRQIKSMPDGVDEWSHPYHGPDNNPQSKDRVAHAPYLTQFLSEPRYAPLPQVAVASNGRIFKAFGHIAFKPREEPWLNTLAAFSGYNGTLLWRREIPEGLMVHRNTLIATPDKLYYGDDRSCKVIDAASGELLDEIIPPEELCGGTFWKWMALEDGVLYALVGETEQRDPTIRLGRLAHGWPWNPLSPGYNQPEHPWGFGRTLLAIDTKSHKILWHHREEEPVDSRALCMSHGRIYAFRPGGYLVCLDANDGTQRWRKTPQNDGELFQTLGSALKRQDWRTNWRTTAYLKCSEKALYFAGPQVASLLAVSTEEGRLLWEHPYSNYQLILREDGVYALSGQVGKEVGLGDRFDPELSKQTEPSRVFDPLTGKILAEVNLGRRACTRPTGAIDAIFCRASGGSTRWDTETKYFGLVSPMRAQCHDGVTIANGRLYWWPSTCDCNLTLYGITCLAPAGNFDFAPVVDESSRLESGAASTSSPAAMAQTPADWPMFRADVTGSVTNRAVVPTRVRQPWRYELPGQATPTAPAAVADLVFLAGSDGIVRALDRGDGSLRWRAMTGGAIRWPPTVEGGRVFVGSGDGWVYAWEAASGRQLWRFRAAPVERRIPVYGQLQSTWPAASGVLVADGTAYVAAGIVNYDGTHVYALDAASGRLRWQNSTTGHLDPEARTGVSVQGHLLLHDQKLYLAGGNVVSPAVFDVKDGSLLNQPSSHIGLLQQNNVPSSQSVRGSDLYLIGNQVRVAGKPLYAHPDYDVYDATVDHKTLVTTVGEREVVWLNNARLTCFARGDTGHAEQFLRNWGKPAIEGLEPIWSHDCGGSQALAVGANAAVVAGRNRLVTVDLSNGSLLWTEPLPAPPVPWGLALANDGSTIVTLKNGLTLCFAAAPDSEPEQTEQN